MNFIINHIKKIKTIIYGNPHNYTNTFIRKKATTTKKHKSK